MNNIVKTPYGLKEAVCVTTQDFSLSNWHNRQIKPKFKKQGYGADDPELLDLIIDQVNQGNHYVMSVENANQFGLSEEQFNVLALASESTCADCDVLHEVSHPVVAKLRKMENGNYITNNNGNYIYEDKIILPPGRHRFSKQWKTVKYEKRKSHAFPEKTTQKNEKKRPIESTLVAKPKAEFVEVKQGLKILGHIDITKPKTQQPTVKKPTF